MWLTRFALNRPVITAMVFVALAVFGAISYFQLGRSQNPPGVEFPIVIVQANYPGASPQDMERLVIKPIEDQMDGIDHLDQISATAQEGTATVVVQFQIGTNLDLAAVDVQRRVDTARIYMPSDMDPPYVYKNGSSSPLLMLAVSSRSLSPTALTEVVINQVKPLLQQIPNVQAVTVDGALTREFHVQPDPSKLLAMNATLGDVFNAVAQNNALLPGGLLEQPTREASVNINAEINHAGDLAAIPLPIPGQSNRYLRIGDVAAVSDSHVEQRSISHYNGKPELYVSLSRDISADEIKSTQIARQQVKKIEAQFPQLTFTEIGAPADYVQASLNGVWQSLFEGIFLTAIVMMLFLHAWRNAAVVMIAIPTSILSTFVAMNLLGFHLDMMSLMGLSLIIGILVDDSIVVLENIARHRDLGQAPIEAAINGRTEIGGAAIAITMVDVVVFLPIALLSGIVGQYLREYALVVVIATLFSLFVSFTLTPLLAGRWSVKQRSQGRPRWMDWFKNVWLDAGLSVVGIALAAFVPNGYLKVIGIFVIALVLMNMFVQRYDRILEFYKSRALPFGLAHGTFVVYVCVALLLNAFMLLAPTPQHALNMAVVKIDALLCAGSAIYFAIRSLLRGRQPRNGSAKRVPVMLAAMGLPLVLLLVFAPLGQISFDFVPNVQTGEINMTVTYPPGTPIRTTENYVHRLEMGILKIDGIKSVTSVVGSKPFGWGEVVGGNYAQLNAQTRKSRRGDTNAIIGEIRKLGYLTPGGDLQAQGDTGGGSGTPIFYSVSGPDNELNAAAEKIATVLRNTPGSVNVATSSEVAAPRLNVNVNAATAALLGVSPAQAALQARLALAGGVATKVRTPAGLVDVRVQLPYSVRNSLQTLESVRVRAADGTLVPLSDIATFQWTNAPTKIDHLNRQRVVNIFGDNLPNYSLGAVTGPLERDLRTPGFLPPGVTVHSQGDTKYMMETMVNMIVALVISFMLVYMLMVILYGSFVEPLIVMFAVPLAIIGAFFALGFMHLIDPNGGQSLNLLSMLGIVMLFGLVAKNGILLVDYSNTLTKRGMRVRDAVLQAAATRFRPILMTTTAMVFGMLPLAIGLSEGGEWRQAMGTVIIGGLLSSLILTLFLVPMIYNTWMGALERRADRRALKAEMVLQPVPDA